MDLTRSFIIEQALAHGRELRHAEGSGGKVISLIMGAVAWLLH